MRLTFEMKFFSVVVLVSLIVIGFAVRVFSYEPPAMAKSSLVLPTSEVLGSATAKNYLVEFSDFECPACKYYQPAVDEITKEYGAQLFFVYRHFPLSQHQFGKRAAIAAEAAGEQGQFWKMHDYLFAHQELFSDSFFEALPKALGLDASKYQASLSSDKASQKVEDDTNAGLRLNVNSTPSFFLNGVKVTPRDREDLKRIVKEAIGS